MFASFSNQKFDLKADNPYTPAAFTWPSSMPDDIQSDLREQLQKLFTLLNLKTSIYNIETRQGTDGKGYIMEVSPRGGGNRLSEMLKYACGTDLIKNAILAAVGEKCEDLQHPKYTCHLAECIIHSSKTGVFKEMKIDPILNIVENDLWVKPGDTVKTFTGANEAIGTLVLKFNSREEMESTVNNIDNFIEIVVE